MNRVDVCEVAAAPLTPPAGDFEDSAPLEDAVAIVDAIDGEASPELRYLRERSLRVGRRGGRVARRRTRAGLSRAKVAQHMPAGTRACNFVRHRDRDRLPWAVLDEKLHDADRSCSGRIVDQPVVDDPSGTEHIE